MARPNRLVNISIQGAERTAQAAQEAQTRRVLEQWLKAYRDAGMDVPKAVQAKAERYGVKV